MTTGVLRPCFACGRWAKWRVEDNNSLLKNHVYCCSQHIARATEKMYREDVPFRYSFTLTPTSQLNEQACIFDLAGLEERR